MMEYELRRGALRARVTTKGAELIALQGADGTQYIWEGDPAVWPGRNPNLFPIVGGLKGGAVSFGEQTVRMGRHGFARDMEFALVRHEEDAILLQLQENDITLAQYPFRFALTIRHQLLDNGFTTMFQVENRDQKVLPFCIGGHTAFRCPMGEGERFEDYQLVFEHREDVASPLVTTEGTLSQTDTERFLADSDTLPLDYDLFRRVDTVMFRGLRSKQVSLVHRASGRGVRMDFGQFPMVAFWTKAGAPFLCMEPWHGCAALERESGQFTEKPYCICLRPGEKKQLSYTVTLLPKMGNI
jgi:galactose mutarotase-like enzyme